MSHARDRHDWTIVGPCTAVVSTLRLCLWPVQSQLATRMQHLHVLIGSTYSLVLAEAHSSM
jgi:hypothetical protein